VRTFHTFLKAGPAGRPPAAAILAAATTRLVAVNQPFVCLALVRHHSVQAKVDRRLCHSYYYYYYYQQLTLQSISRLTLSRLPEHGSEIKPTRGI
jgi:hypothetical protein